ncbi:hypothetical protein T07_14645, partial [Trichinella nelsoni]
LLFDFQDFHWSYAQLIKLFKEPIQAFLADEVARFREIRLGGPNVGDANMPTGSGLYS